MVLPLAVPPATPMKNGIARPKLALDLLGETGVPRVKAAIEAPFEASVLIFRPIPFFASAAELLLLTIQQLGVLAEHHDQAAASCFCMQMRCTSLKSSTGSTRERRQRPKRFTTAIVIRSAGNASDVSQAILALTCPHAAHYPDVAAKDI